MSRPLAIFLALTMGLVLSVFGGIVWLMGDLGWRDHIRDEVLICDLEAHADQYEQLITMFREDRAISIVHPTFISPENAITDERWDKYKRLFRELGLDAGMRERAGGGLWFISTAQGFVTHGSSKGYLYRPEDKPAPSLPNLDEIPEEPRGINQAFRRISSDWYLVLDWD